MFASETRRKFYQHRSRRESGRPAASPPEPAPLPPGADTSGGGGTATRCAVEAIGAMLCVLLALGVFGAARWLGEVGALRADDLPVLQRKLAAAAAQPALPEAAPAEEQVGMAADETAGVAAPAILPSPADGEPFEAMPQAHPGAAPPSAPLPRPRPEPG